MIFLFVLCLIFCSSYCAALLYMSGGFKKTNQPISGNTKVSVSVIIPVRNEEVYITRLLNALSMQTCSQENFEVIIVNDNSEDNTAAVVEEYISSGKLKRCRLLHSPGSGKKGALTAGIYNAKGDLIVTTDADCEMGPQWLDVIAAHYEKTQAEMLVAPVAISKSDSITGRIQQLDYMAMQVCGLGSLSRGNPLLCSGANLAFTHSAFYAVKGYEGNENVASGDDTFLMLKFDEVYGSPYAILDERAIVEAGHRENITEFIHQQIRWGSKIKYYRSNYIKGIGLAVFTGNLCYVLSFILLFAGCYIFFIIIAAVKLCTDAVILHKGRKFFHGDETIRFSPVMLIYPFLFIFIGMAAWSGRYRWKGRLYRV